jgi:hypothetical protein
MQVEPAVCLLDPTVSDHFHFLQLFIETASVSEACGILDKQSTMYSIKFIELTKNGQKHLQNQYISNYMSYFMHK